MRDRVNNQIILTMYLVISSHLRRCLGHAGDNINSLVLSFVERVLLFSKVVNYRKRKYLGLQAVSLVER